MEIISVGSESYVKMICRPGSIIVEIPYDKNIRLGDRIIVTGNLDIISTEKYLSSKTDYGPKN